MTDPQFGFEGAGYVNAADWARLHDLIPDHSRTPQQKAARASFEQEDTKRNVCALLVAHGVSFDHAFDPEAAAKGNA